MQTAHAHHSQCTAEGLLIFSKNVCNVATNFGFGIRHNNYISTLENPHFSVVYEDNHLLVVNKKGGVLVQKDDNDEPSLVDYTKEYLREKYNKPGNIFCEPAHRIDRPVSGLVVFCKTSKALERMNEVFHNRQVEKRYWAISVGRPEQLSGYLVHWIKKNKDKNRVNVYHYERNDARKAELMYKVVNNVGSHYLIEVKLITGRHHQIRAQLSFVGSPILGDIKYKAPEPAFGHFIFLHARYISFQHPVTKEQVEFYADIPDHRIWQLFIKERKELADFSDLEKLREAEQLPHNNKGLYWIQ